MDDLLGVYSNIIGAKCKIRAIPVTYSYKKLDRPEPESFTYDSEHTITGVYHRVMSDGRIHPVYELKDFPGRLFKPSELWITCVPPQNKD